MGPLPILNLPSPSEYFSQVNISRVGRRLCVLGALWKRVQPASRTLACRCGLCVFFEFQSARGQAASLSTSPCSFFGRVSFPLLLLYLSDLLLLASRLKQSTERKQIQAVNQRVCFSPSKETMPLPLARGQQGSRRPTHWMALDPYRRLCPLPTLGLDCLTPRPSSPFRLQSILSSLGLDVRPLFATVPLLPFLPSSHPWNLSPFAASASSLVLDTQTSPQTNLHAPCTITFPASLASIYAERTPLLAFSIPNTR